jgi:hypothetical protein
MMNIYKKMENFIKIKKWKKKTPKIHHKVLA